MIDRRTARALCTASEFELVLESLAVQARAPSKARLKAKIARARALRDKYRDLFRRQRRAGRARTGAKVTARSGENARTAQKARLFAETLARFADRLRALEAAERKAAAAKQRMARRGRATAAPAKTLRPARRRSRTVSKTGFVSEQAASANRRQRLHNMRAKAVQAHMRSRGRRSQARRDARSR